MKRFLLPFLLITNSLFFVNVQASDDIIGGLTLEENFQLAKKFPMPSPWLLAAQCSACHGTLGAEYNEIIPPLAGMNKDEFIERMQAYKTGEANDFIVMGIITQPITDEEIIAMAEFFAEQKPVPWNKEKGHKDVVVPEWAKMKVDKHDKGAE